MHRFVINRKSPYLLLSAISLGVAFIIRSTSILVVVSLFVMITVYYLKNLGVKTTVRLIPKNVILFFLAFLPFIWLTLWYNHYRFGSIFETGHLLRASHMGINFFTGTPLLTGLSGFLISPGKGFFYYSPVAIFFFFGIKSFFKKHFELAICFILIMLSYLFFLSKNLYWHGDWAWGPRYLLVITPFLIIPIAEFFDSDIWMKRKVLKPPIYLIIVVSLIIQLGAISVDFNKYFLDLRINKKIEFIIAHGEGVQPIIEPPIDTYFDCHKSPILAQFRFIYDMTREIKNYRYSKPPNGASFIDTIRADPVLNVFDFWWMYNYFVEESYSGFIVALLLLSVAIYYALRLWTLACL
jgi:hypothetical protein